MNRKELEGYLREIQASAELHSTAMEEQARLLHATYRHLIDAGFTEEEAFKLILYKGINLVGEMTSFPPDESG